LAKPHIVIISPALAKANNGNWQTANRWAHFLRSHYRMSLHASVEAMTADGQVDPPALIIALHAKRSAAAVAAFRQQFPAIPVLLVLTGTDLYRDLRIDAQAKKTVNDATQLVVLQDAALDELDAAVRQKASVIYQSAPALQPMRRDRPARHFDVIMVGHMRDEKDPATFMRAAAQISMPTIHCKHIGAALDPAYAAQAQATQLTQPHYHWLGNVAHAKTRQILKRSHLMVITSKMEGGANVIIEAVTSGVPVLASRMSGNLGMLGRDYEGYFPVGDDVALARLIERAASDPSYYQRLAAQCDARAVLFTPEREKAALLHLVDNLLQSAP
jgi:putative glycosyltransferase (TIGR04348 family)